MKKSSLIPTLVLAGATSLAAMLTPVAAKAVSVTYNVNRSWSDGINNASLVGTVAVPLGYYTLQENDASPFTSVNLTLRVNGSPFTLNAAYNNSNGDGTFFINATSSELTFDTANAAAPNSAALYFGASGSDYTYGIQTYDSSLEYASTEGSDPSVYASVSFPVTFGTAQAQQVPEPLTILGTGVVLGAIPVLKKEYAKRNKKK